MGIQLVSVYSTVYAPMGISFYTSNFILFITSHALTTAVLFLCFVFIQPKEQQQQRKSTGNRKVHFVKIAGIKFNQKTKIASLLLLLSLSLTKTFLFNFFLFFECENMNFSSKIYKQTRAQCINN